jgi:hypothetical protein
MLSFHQDISLLSCPGKKKVKVTISEICVRRLCNNNRYGKDKTVVIAMGKGKRMKTASFRTQRDSREKGPNCRNAKRVGCRKQRKESVQLCVC